MVPNFTFDTALSGGYPLYWQLLAATKVPSKWGANEIRVVQCTDSIEVMEVMMANLDSVDPREAALSAAVKLVREGGKSVRKASELAGCDKSTLSRRLRESCPVCGHRERRHVDALLRGGDTPKNIAHYYGLDDAEVVRHAAHFDSSWNVPINGVNGETDEAEEPDEDEVTIAALTRKRASLAVDVVDGNKAAGKELDKVEAELNRIRTEKERARLVAEERGRRERAATEKKRKAQLKHEQKCEADLRRELAKVDADEAPSLALSLAWLRTRTEYGVQLDQCRKRQRKLGDNTSSKEQTASKVIVRENVALVHWMGVLAGYRRDFYSASERHRGLPVFVKFTDAVTKLENGKRAESEERDERTDVSGDQDRSRGRGAAEAEPDVDSRQTHDRSVAAEPKAQS